jgi:hypothetical protein
MASNNLTSNTSTKIARAFLPAFEQARILSKTVNTTMIQGEFTPQYGATIYVKRPHDYKSFRSNTGDISAQTMQLVSGTAPATVQQYITTWADWTNYEEALQLDQLEEILAPAAQRLAIDLELDFARYMLKNCNLSVGTPGTAVDTWAKVAAAGAMMDSIGIPQDGERFYVMNPFVRTTLAGVQLSLNQTGPMVQSAWEKAVVTNQLGNMTALSTASLGTYATNAGADRAGTLSATPTATYVAHKDTMLQTLAVTGFQANLVVSAGEVIQVTGRGRVNIATKQTMLDASGAQVLWRGVVQTGVTLGASGEGNLTVAGPAILEATGAYNTVASALTSGDVITLLGAASTTYQPNMFYHKDAYGIASVKLPKLYSTDTVATTKDGLSIRVSKYSNGDTNTQKVRFDLLPAYATFNPFFAGHGYG